MTVVTGAVPDEARQVITAAVADRGARLVEAASGTQVHGDRQDGHATLVIETPEDRYGPLTLALRGEHQVGNAVVAIRLLEAARAAGIWLPGDAIECGLTGVEWPARLELIPLADGKQVLLDAAHNVDGAKALAAYLARWHQDRPALVIGVMRDKDVEGMIDSLLPVVSSVTATAAATPRAMAADELAARVRARRSSSDAPGETAVDVHVDLDPVHAIEQALARDHTVCVAGSIFLAGNVRDALRRRAILR
jgi:dihydrofolate synthase/folylpolyglutamate synthase